jgi:hypothetical protein
MYFVICGTGRCRLDLGQCMLVPVLWLMFVVCWSMYDGSTGGY